MRVKRFEEYFRDEPRYASPYGTSIAHQSFLDEWLDVTRNKIPKEKKKMANVELTIRSEGGSCLTEVYSNTFEEVVATTLEQLDTKAKSHSDSAKDIRKVMASINGATKRK